MSDDYLWSRSGPPDALIARLEQELAPHASLPPFEWPPRKGREWWKPALAMAACLCVIWGAFLISQRPAASEWKLTDGAAVSAGARLRTSHQKLELTADSTGTIELEPDSELQLPRNREDRAFSLKRGQIHAFIWAPPGKFVVSTPSARTVDLGCEYRLAVNPDGSGLLTVETGWVALQAGAYESFIPAGAACYMSRRDGPSLPYYLDSTTPFQQALLTYREHPDSAAIDSLLSQARPRDAFTLWHLLRRIRPAEHSKVFKRLCELEPAACLADPDASWNALDLGDMSFWREWKRTWKQ